MPALRTAKLLALLCAVLALVSCNRDPKVVSRKYVESGDRYLTRGKFKEASIMYRNALAKDPLYGMAHYQLAQAELKLSRVPEAVKSLRRAVELLPKSSPEHWDAAIKLADIYIAMSSSREFLDDAERTARELLQRDANSYDGHRLTADLAFVAARRSFASAAREEGQSQLETAIQEYRKADSIKPDQPGLRMALARALAAGRQFTEAEALYKGVLAKDKTVSVAYMELYQLCLYQNKIDEGEQTLKTAFANNPKQYNFLTLLAAHYYGLRRRDDMVKVLNQMKSHAAEFPQVYTMAGDFYLRVGDGDEAIRQYKEGMAADAPRKLEYQKRIIEVLMRQGKKAEAAEINNAILKERPKDNDARGLAGSLLLDKGDVTRAIAELQSVVSGAPDNFVARFHLGRAHMMRGEWEQARQQFQQSVKLRPDYLPARLALAQLQATRGEYDEALKSVHEILQVDKQNMNARLIESAVLMGMKRYGESRKVLQAMLEANPSSPDALVQMGVVNLAENKYKEAEESFHKAYQLNPANSRGLMGIVETYMAQNKVDQALQVLQEESRRSPNRGDLHLALGNTAVRAGKYDLAISEYRKIVDSAPGNSRAAAEVYLRLGETYRRKGDLNSSVSALQKAREAMPENAMVVSSLALTLDAAGRRQEAKAAYEQAVKLDFDRSNGVARNNLAFLMAEYGGDLDQALTFAQQAKQVLPNLNEVSDTLGWIYLKKNLSDNAIAIFAELVKKEPNHSTYRYHLGMAFYQKGDKLRALKELQLALKSNPPKDEASKIQELMSKIG